MRRPHSLVDSFSDAFIGMSTALKEERNMRIHIAFAGAVIILSLWLGVKRYELAVLMLTIGAVISLELVNTAIERLVDLAEPNENPLAALTKRLAASAVLVTAIVAAAIGLVILVPYLKARLGM